MRTELRRLPTALVGDTKQTGADIPIATRRCGLCSIWTTLTRYFKVARNKFGFSYLPVGKFHLLHGQIPCESVLHDSAFSAGRGLARTRALDKTAFCFYNERAEMIGDANTPWDKGVVCVFFYFI